MYEFLRGNQVDRGTFGQTPEAQDLSARRADLWLAALNSFYRPDDGLPLDRLTNSQTFIPVDGSQIGFELAKVISGRPDVLGLACEHNFTRGVRLMATMLTVQNCFRTIAFFGNTYTKACRFRCLRTSRGSAIINIQPTSTYAAFVAPYFPACMSNNCDIGRGTMGAIPTTVYGLSGAEIIDTACCVHDVPPEARARHVPSEVEPEDEQERALGHCQFLFRWRPQLTGYQRLASPAALATLAVPPALVALWASGAAGSTKAVATSQIVTLPAGLYLLQALHRLGRRHREVSRYIQEQEARFERERHALTMVEIALHHRPVEDVVDGAPDDLDHKEG